MINTRLEHVRTHIEVLRLSKPASCKPYRHTDHVCKDQGSKAAAISDANLSQTILSQRIQLQSGTSCNGINSLRCGQQIDLTSSFMVDTIVYLVLVLLINIFCHLFWP